MRHSNTERHLFDRSRSSVSEIKHYMPGIAAGRSGRLDPEIHEVEELRSLF